MGAHSLLLQPPDLSAATLPSSDHDGPGTQALVVMFYHSNEKVTNVFCLGGLWGPPAVKTCRTYSLVKGSFILDREDRCGVGL